jgi:hypothetical protein
MARMRGIIVLALGELVVVALSLKFQTPPLPLQTTNEKES